MTRNYIKTKNAIVSVLLAAVVVTSASCGCQKKPDNVATPTPKPTEVAIVTEAPTTEPENTENGNGTENNGTSAPDVDTTATPSMENEAPSSEVTAEPTGEAADSTELPGSDDPDVNVSTGTATAAPTATPKPTTTSKPTATPKPTPTPTPTPTPASKYPWSNEVTSYLTDSSRGFYLRDNSSFGTAGEAYSCVAGTIFGKCAMSSNGGIHYIDEYTHVETVNANGVIAQAVVRRYFDYSTYEWVDGNVIEGVYLDADYVKPGATLKTELTLEETVWYGILKTKANDVEITRQQLMRDDIACNYYPLSTGEFVLDLGGRAVILNKTPQSVSIMYDRVSTTGFENLQIAVDGHVVYEADHFAYLADQIPDYTEEAVG